MIRYAAKQKLKKLALYLSLATCLFALTIEGSVGTIPFGLIGTLLVTSLSGTTAALLQGKTTHPKTLQASRIILFVGLFAMLVSFTFYKIQIHQNYKQAAILVETIDNYEKENGEYPSTLENLVPDFLKKTPKVKVGFVPNAFDYENTSANTSNSANKKTNTDTKALKNESDESKSKKVGYVLSYHCYLGVTYIYNSNEGHWQTD